MDSVDGFDRAPDRYMAEGRETIDRIRDVLGDRGFVSFCVGNAIKYADRAGLKGDAAGDLKKRNFYDQMARHVMGKGPDPRADRPGFVPYKRLRLSDMVVEVQQENHRLDAEEG